LKRIEAAVKKEAVSAATSEPGAEAVIL